MKILLSLMGLAVASGTALSAQEPSTPSVMPAQAFSTWQSNHEGTWILRERPETQAGQFLYGGQLAPSYTPTSPADFQDLAFDGLKQASDMFQIAASTLIPGEFKYLELSRIGGTDKISQNFLQAHNGVPVVRGDMSFLFTPAGDLLAIDSNALPEAEHVNTNPLIKANRASRAASQYFVGVKEQAINTQTIGELVIYPYNADGRITPRLSWAFEIYSQVEGQVPAGLRIYVAADHASVEILGSDELVHECGFGAPAAGPNDLQGHVESWATPGTLPDTNSNPEVQFPGRYMRVTSSAGNANTDGLGNFVIPYTGTANVDLTFAYTGNYCRVTNQAGSNYSYVQSFSPGMPGNAFLNVGRTEKDTAHANAYRSVTNFREWLVGIDPSDSHLDFQMRANVNINDNCNAYFSGNTINFYTSGGGCVNTAFSTIVAHEEGHYANVLYNSGNGSDGFGEGASDVWAMYLYDTVEVGSGFCGPGCGVRRGDNNRQFCGDRNGGCYGQVHSDGLVLMGALWKVRDNLNTSLGNSAGDLVADTLLISWFNAYNDSQIRTVIEDHWLALDDDDGNISNGTPNYFEINGGFVAQGFPGVDANYISFAHAAHPDTQNESGYSIEANLASLVGGTITQASLHYSVDGGAEDTVSMTNVSGSTWSAAIPGQISPRNVTYWIAAEDGFGNTDRHPKKLGEQFLVGLRRVIYFTDFETAGDDGWTHQYGSGSASDDDWERGTPQGKADDPLGAHSGSMAWGNDLGTGSENGKYQANVNIRLVSPSVDCSGHSDVRLRFARSLSVEHGSLDFARLRVGGSKIWESPKVIDTIDSDWSMFEYDVSAQAGNNADVIMQWVLNSDNSWQFGGWNVDDVMLYTPLPSGSSNTILLNGDSAPIAGTTTDFAFQNGPAYGTWHLVFSLNNAGSLVNGHAFDIGPGFTIAATGSFDINGSGAASIPIPPSAVGVLAYGEVAGIDSEGALTDSNMLAISVQ
ncbi:MAG: hypothetical protein H8E15_06595 [Planctomycetes bacterium]|nr:hypothetical protein [Planctomycetota bacterium]